jgi:cation diffusion facilitator family transporter
LNFELAKLVRHEVQVKEFSVVILNAVVNTLLAFAKVVIGTLFQSPVLVADGVHSFSDLVTDIFAAIGLKVSNRAPDDDHPFGHGGAEYIFNATVAMIIFIFTGLIIIEFIQELTIPSESVSSLVVATAIITFAVKLIVSQFTLKKGEELSSETLRNSGMEGRGDAITSLVMVVGILITSLGIEHNIPALQYTDKVATVYIIYILLGVSFEIYRNALINAANTHASDNVTHRYRETITSYDINVPLDDLLVFKNGTQNKLIIYIDSHDFSNIQELLSYTKQLRNHLQTIHSDIAYIAIEYK